MDNFDVTNIPTQILSKMIALFREYAEDFGIKEEDCLERQCDFEDKFRELICEYERHHIGSGHCGKPEHDYCYECRKSRAEIEALTKSQEEVK